LRLPLRRARLLRGGRHKRFVLKQMKGLAVSQVEGLARKYLSEVIVPHERTEVVEKIRWHQQQGHVVVIVSAGYAVYLTVYAERYGVDYVIATDLEVRDSIYTGRILGIDCIKKNKVTKLTNTLSLDEFDLAASYAYSDEENDVPLLELVDHPYVIDAGQGVAWAKERGYEILGVS